MELSPTVRMARRMAHSMTHSNAYVTKNLIRNENLLRPANATINHNIKTRTY